MALVNSLKLFFLLYLTSSFTQSEKLNLFSFGSNEYGQLGLNSNETFVSVPTSISFLPVAIKDFAAGRYHSLLLTENGEVFAFGTSNFGALGTNNTYFTPTPILIKFFQRQNISSIAVSCGFQHSLVLADDGKVYSFGANHHGQLGLGDNTNRFEPTLIASLFPITFTAISAGSFHSLLLADTGQVFSFGNNDHGQLGINSFLPENNPMLISSLSLINSIRAGSTHSLALTSDGRVYCWGSNEDYQLCLVTRESQVLPVLNSLNADIKSISAGIWHTLLLSSNGSVYGCGINMNGELGLGDTNLRNTPTEIPLTSKIIKVSAAYHSLFLADDGRVFGSGLNHRGQLGLGNTNVVMSPTVISFMNATLLRVGFYHSFILGKSIYDTNVTTGTTGASTTDSSVSVEESEPELTPGEIAAITISTTSATFLFAVVGAACYFRRRRKKRPQQEIEMTSSYLTDVQVGEAIGSGNYSDVYKGTWMKTDVALKKHKNTVDTAFLKEVEILKQLNHPSIIRYLGLFKSDKGDIFIVQEYISGGSLFDAFSSMKYKFNNDKLLFISKEVAAGLHYLHENKIVHGDLAIRNVLISFSSDGDVATVKLTDFGMSKMLKEKDVYISNNSDQVPTRWSPLEVIKAGKWTTSSDIWSFGVLLWEIFSLGKIPFAGLSNLEVIEALEQGKRLENPELCPERIWNIIMKCWNSEPSERPTSKAVSEDLNAIFMMNRLDNQ